MMERVISSRDAFTCVVAGAGQIATLDVAAPVPRKGRDMAQIGVGQRLAVAVQGELIAEVADESLIFRDSRFTSATTVIDAGGRLVTPGLVDPHTHFIFAGHRADEFEEKISGVPYLEIAARGGGIKRTVRETTAADVQTLAQLGRQRLDRYLELGVTTVEVKSGYGLSLESELRMLMVARDLDDMHPVDVVPTLLAAHEFPVGTSREDYLRLVIERIIPAVAEQRLAEFCDVFCERGVYTVAESEQVLRAGLRAGLMAKIHAEQVHHTGGSTLAAKLGAASADHLEHIDQAAIQQLADSETVAVLLPGCTFFMGLRDDAPARSMIDQGVAVALATDFNPGSCMTQNLQLIMTMGCVRLRMTPAEVLTAVTVNAAHALRRSSDRGRIKRGLLADLAVFDAGDVRDLVYHFGKDHTWMTIKNGRVCWRKQEPVQ